MRICKLLLFIMLAVPICAAPISKEVHAAVMRVADDVGVPRSIANQLQIEESGNWMNGSWGDAQAINGHEPGGWESRGLYQLYYKPSNINELLAKYWVAFYETETFDPFNPIHSAKVGLRYLAALHRRWGSWLAANAYYNGGSAYSWTRAKRIIDAGEP